MNIYIVFLRSIIFNITLDYNMTTIRMPIQYVLMIFLATNNRMLVNNVCIRGTIIILIIKISYHSSQYTIFNSWLYIVAFEAGKNKMIMHCIENYDESYENMYSVLIFKNIDFIFLYIDDIDTFKY